MASTINAKSTGVGGIDASCDSSGVLELQTGGTTAVTIDASQNVSLVKPLPIASGGTGTTTGIARYVSSAQTITIAGLLTLAHGLGAKPYRIFTTLVCVTAEYNYAIGDELFVTHYQESSSAVDAYGLSLTIDATNLNIRYGSGPTTVFVANNKTTGAGVNLTNANWRFYIRAEL